MSKTVPQFAVNELVNVAIRGARVTNTYPTTKNGADAGRILVADYPGRGDLGFAINLAASGVTVERVAPAEWPPQPGDVWLSASNGSGSLRWFGADDLSSYAAAGDVQLISSDGRRTTVSQALQDFPGWRLESRPGWTPTKTTPAEPEQVDERDARTRMVANIRALADFIETRTDLPVPNSCRAQYSHIVNEPYEARVAAVQRWGSLVDGPEFSDDRRSFDLRFGGTKRWQSHLAVYVVHTAEREPDEPAEDDQADTDPEAPTPAPASWTCPYCLFVASESNVEAALAHVADHEAGRAVAMTDAQLDAAYDEGAAPLPHRPTLADVPPAPNVPLSPDDEVLARALTALEGGEQAGGAA